MVEECQKPTLLGGTERGQHPTTRLRLGRYFVLSAVSCEPMPNLVSMHLRRNPNTRMDLKFRDYRNRNSARCSWGGTRRSSPKAGRTLNIDDILAALKLPVLVTQGAAERLALPAAAKYTAAKISGAKLSLYDGIGHAPFWEDTALQCRTRRLCAGSQQDQLTPAYSLAENEAGRPQRPQLGSLRCGILIGPITALGRLRNSPSGLISAFAACGYAGLN